MLELAEEKSEGAKQERERQREIETVEFCRFSTHKIQQKKRNNMTTIFALDLKAKIF